MSHSSTKVGVTAHNHVHESHWILLDSSVYCWIVLLYSSHELLVKLRVLSHSLGHVRELRVLHQTEQFGRSWHASHAGLHSTRHTTWWLLAHTCILVTIISEAGIAACWNLVEIDTFKKKRASEVSITTCQLQCLDALVSRFTCNGKQGAQSLLFDARRQSTGRRVVGLSLRLGLSRRLLGWRIAGSRLSWLFSRCSWQSDSRLSHFFLFGILCCSCSDWLGLNEYKCKRK